MSLVSISEQALNNLMRIDYSHCPYDNAPIYFIAKEYLREIEGYVPENPLEDQKYIDQINKIKEQMKDFDFSKKETAAVFIASLGLKPNEKLVNYLKKMWNSVDHEPEVKRIAHLIIATLEWDKVSVNILEHAYSAVLKSFLYLNCSYFDNNVPTFRDFAINLNYELITKENFLKVKPILDDLQFYGNNKRQLKAA